MMLEDSSEVTTSLYKFYKDHVEQLRDAGYSPKEAFWLDFACLPFLPWDEHAENEIRLSQVLRLYFRIYSSSIDSNIKPEDKPAFIDLLKDRYDMVRNIISTVASSQLQLELGRFILPDHNDDEMWVHAGLVVLNTKFEWEEQRRQNPIPYRLVNDCEPADMTFSFEGIAGRKRAEKQPRKPPEGLEHVLAKSLVTIYTSKIGGNWAATSISENVRDRFGYEPHEFTQDPDFWLTHIHPDDRQRILAELSRLLENNFHTQEYRFLHKDGSYRWVLDEVRLISDKKNSPLKCVGYITDITAHKLTEQKIRESEEKYRTLVESTSESIVTFDENGVFLFLNTIAAAVLGGKPQDYIGKTMWDVFPKEIADWQAAVVRKVINTGQKMSTISTTPLKGELRQYHAIVEPLQDRSKNKTIAMVVARDIHTAKQAS